MSHLAVDPKPKIQQGILCIESQKVLQLLSYYDRPLQLSCVYVLFSGCIGRSGRKEA